MPPPTRSEDWLKEQLEELERTLGDMGPDFSGYALMAGELGQRLREGRFRLAVLGQFKRGKSTLLNALLHEPLLPTGILPLTAIPTTLRYGPERRIWIHYLDGRSEDYDGSLEQLQTVLTRYVTEQGNPANRLGVTRVEVDHPAAFLAQSVEITDTPGIGSTVLHNTRTARAMVPVCDGALFVLSPDPPITEVEVQFLRAVRESATRVIFVLTKADMLAPSERQQLVTFLKQAIRDDAGFSGEARIFLVSARQALEAALQDTQPLHAESGVSQLESFLTEFLLTDKRAALQDAIQRKGARLIQEACFSLDLQRKILELPREDLARRAERFEAHLAKINREQGYLHDRLRGDRQRLLEEVDQQAAILSEQAQEALGGFVQKACDEARHDTGRGGFETQIRSALSDEVQRMFARATKDLFAMTTERFQSLQELHCRDMEGLIHRIRQTAAEVFEVPCLEGVVLDRLGLVREPRLVGHRWVTSFTEQATSYMSRFLPARFRARRVEQRLQDDVRYLVARNMGELRWTTSQNLADAFLQFEIRLETQLTSVHASIQASIHSAWKLQEQRESRQGPELRRLQHHRQHLEQAWATLSGQEPSSLGGGLV